MAIDDKNPKGRFTIGPYVDQRVSSVGQSGGITAHTVNMRPPPRDFNGPRMARAKEQLLQSIPRDAKVAVQAAMGDAEAYALSMQVFEFLKAHGYANVEHLQTVWTQPVTGLALGIEGDTHCVQIGHNPGD
jgi:hypothetical protein